MSSPLIDRELLDFLLFDVLDVEALQQYPRFSEHSRATMESAIDLAHQLALEKFYPHNRAADIHEPKLVDGKVWLLPEAAEAVKAYNDAGFAAALEDFERGGMQLPFVIASACDLLFAAANPGTVAYPSLARGAANLMKAYASERQQRLYMDPITQGRYFGTMCLSEPQAGSSLADIRTSAKANEDGSYNLTGAKMWISAGEHELGENIVHLVLARIEGAPAGVRGISLFIVPRYRVDEAGAITGSNDVLLAGLNHKLGQRGSVNTFLKFGESGACRAELIGTANQGLAYMFHMMNEERIAVGMGAIANGLVAYLYSRGYANERKQGRHPDQKDPASAPVALIEHADIRRLLLVQKTRVEGALALGLYASMLVDLRDQLHASGMTEQAQAHDARLELLTPIVKAWSSHHSLIANDCAIQILGGYGYTREYPVEQCWRDNRINPIHEGTNGIQALDLLGRKVMAKQGASLAQLLSEVQALCADIDAPELLEGASRLNAQCKELGEVTGELGQAMLAGAAREVLAHAEHYMQALGHLCIAWQWLSMANVAAKRLAQQPESRVDFLRSRIHTAQAFFCSELPHVQLALDALKARAEPSVHFQAQWF